MYKEMMLGDDRAAGVLLPVSAGHWPPVHFTPALTFIGDQLLLERLSCVSLRTGVFRSVNGSDAKTSGCVREIPLISRSVCVFACVSVCLLNRSFPVAGSGGSVFMRG